MAIRIYLFPIYLLVSLIGPTKSSPHFINGYFGKLVTNFVRLWLTNPLVFWHASQDLKHSCMSLYIVGHQYLTSNIFLCVSSVAKCLHVGLSRNSFITICAPIVVKHHHSLLLWPILYNLPFFNVKGFVILTNFYFCCINNMPSISHVFKNSFTSFNHSNPI
jgi:hypothetical protein